MASKLIQLKDTDGDVFVKTAGILSASNVLSSTFNISAPYAYAWGKFRYVQAEIWPSSGYFPSGRTSTLCTITRSDFYPRNQFVAICAAANTYNGAVNRWANVIVQTNGNVILDNYNGENVGQVSLVLRYMNSTELGA